MIIMGSLDTHGNLNGNAYRLFYGKSRLLFNVLFQCNALYHFHDEIVNAVFFPYIVHIDDIGMHQPCRRLGLRPKLGNKIGVLGKLLF